MLRGKLGINVNGGKREIGFKFIIKNLYPSEPPCVYLDEAINPLVVAQNDYLDNENRIRIPFLQSWTNIPNKYNLLSLLIEVQKLFSSRPPIAAQPVSS